MSDGNIDYGNNPTGTPPTEDEKAQIRSALDLWSISQVTDALTGGTVSAVFESIAVTEPALVGHDAAVTPVTSGVLTLPEPNEGNILLVAADGPHTVTGVSGMVTHTPYWIVNASGSTLTLVASANIIIRNGNAGAGDNTDLELADKEVAQVVALGATSITVL